MFIVLTSKVDQGFPWPIKICFDVQISHENTRGHTKTMKQRYLSILKDMRNMGSQTTSLKQSYFIKMGGLGS